MTTPDDIAFARARLKAGASDAEVRLELLSRGLPAEVILEVMDVATPRITVNWPFVIVGLGLGGLGGALLATRLSNGAYSAGLLEEKALAVLAALGAFLTMRGFTRRA